ncbi:SDR family NAD(P)-dependent oxidoreductase [Motiliproteus coralliicola]|uniref:SDR family NAD(P)-dependent oxidoreductase n=1 Tax=Motiliproteus coralliicola TaxID=2283196 RepID=A0A369WNW6_9GAMM|nr:SDR family oxidoreductase [Motiliproteus coralliicola]RDE22913.1 SDR family NAD(P)-dependent oxidoreductase [Motiliproteus coralliicola]
MKIAITAANGQLGRAIIRACQALQREQGSNLELIGLARSPDKALDLGIEVRPGSYDEPQQLRRSLQGVDCLLLVSGMDAPEQRIQQHRNVIEAAKSAGVKKIVYTSVQGAETSTSFSPIIQSNRQTEQDVRESGLEWVIGRNGIYIEPDIDYLDSYKQLGAIRNSAAEGRCGYTTRAELGYAYARLLIEPSHNGQTYNLHGEALCQQQLVDYLNQTFDTGLTYEPMSDEAFEADRQQELGEFVGSIIAGIYQGIRLGKSDNPSQFEQAAGRPHLSWDSYFAALAAPK